MARAFNGSSQYLSVTNSAALNPTGKLSIVFTLRETAWTPHFMGKTETDKNDWSINLEDGYLGFFWATNAAGAGTYSLGYSNGAVISFDTTYQVGFVFDGSQSGDANRLKFFLNGTLLTGITYTASVPATLLGSTSVLEFGRAFGNNYLTGSLAEIALWSEIALTDAQMASLVNKSPLLVRRPTCYWPLIGRADPEPDICGGNNAANSGSTNYEHPRVIRRAGPIIVGSSSGLDALVAQVGAIAYTGNNAILSMSRQITATAASYSFAGNDAIITLTKVLTATVAAFAYAGNNAALTMSRVIAATVGAIAFAGTNTGLVLAKVLTATVGAIAYTGNNAALTMSRVISATVGAIAFAGTNTALTLTKVLAATVGAFAFAGNSVGLVVSRVIAATAAAFGFTGNDATLTVSGAIDWIYGDIVSPSGVTLGLPGAHSATLSSPSSFRALASTPRPASVFIG